MSRTVLTGTRIRTERIELGLKQATLAKRCGISASYLNLIEHNRRAIGGALLNRIAAELKVDPSTLNEGAEASLAASLEAAANAYPDIRTETARSQDLAGRFPGWAGLIEAQYREMRRLMRIVDELNDRLTHDPFLSASLHEVLSSVTAIQSASGILAEGDVEPEWQVRFHRNIYEDSQRLGEASENLVRYLEKGDESGSRMLPHEEIETWLSSQNWQIPEIERDDSSSLTTILENSPELKSPTAYKLAAGLIERASEDAQLLPLNVLTNTIANLGANPIELADFLKLDLPLVFRRLASLADSDFPDGQSRGLVSCDGSGALIFRKPLPGFPLPRYGTACPLWPLFQALQSPMMAVKANVKVSGRDKQRFAVHAIAEQSRPFGYSGTTIVQAWMLFAEERTIDDESARPVGPACRVCAEEHCLARHESSVFVDSW